jgi:hypothetical protein
MAQECRGEFAGEGQHPSLHNRATELDTLLVQLLQSVAWPHIDTGCSSTQGS